MKSRAKQVALIGIMAASIEVGKLVLSMIPNVEVVTILCASYGYLFGVLGIISTYFFVLIDCLIYGFNTWVISYVIYWPFVAFVFYLLGRRKICNRFVVTCVAVLLTISFGVLTSLVDTGLFTGFYDKFWYRFSILYMRGITFYLVQIVCNMLLFITTFNSLIKILESIKPKFIQDQKINTIENTLKKEESINESSKETK